MFQDPGYAFDHFPCVLLRFNLLVGLLVEFHGDLSRGLRLMVLRWKLGCVCGQNQSIRGWKNENSPVEELSIIEVEAEEVGGGNNPVHQLDSGK